MAAVRREVVLVSPDVGEEGVVSDVIRRPGSWRARRGHYHSHHPPPGVGVLLVVPSSVSGFLDAFLEPEVGSSAEVEAEEDGCFLRGEFGADGGIAGCDGTEAEAGSVSSAAEEERGRTRRFVPDGLRDTTIALTLSEPLPPEDMV